MESWTNTLVLSVEKHRGPQNLRLPHFLSLSCVQREEPDESKYAFIRNLESKNPMHGVDEAFNLMCL